MMNEQMMTFWLLKETFLVMAWWFKKPFAEKRQNEWRKLVPLVVFILEEQAAPPLHPPSLLPSLAPLLYCQTSVWGVSRVDSSHLIFSSSPPLLCGVPFTPDWRPHSAECTPVPSHLAWHPPHCACSCGCQLLHRNQAPHGHGLDAPQWWALKDEYPKAQLFALDWWLCPRCVLCFLCFAWMRLTQWQ